VQLSNTGAWIAVLATGGFFAAPTLGTWWASALLATASAAVAIGARVRHRLRRHWLVRVLNGRVKGWTIESAWQGGGDTGPVLDLLEATADERFVVAVVHEAGSPYRDARRRAPCGRLKPNW
jgi:hypothetical protein